VVGSYNSFNAAGAASSSAAGAAYIYTRNNGVWKQQQKLVGSGSNGRNAFDYFGWSSVSVFSDIVVAGAYRQDYDDNGANYASASGAAYTFTKIGDTIPGSGQEVIGTVVAQLPSGLWSKPIHYALLKALPTNSNPIYVGTSSNMVGGYTLLPGESTTLYVDNLNKIYCMSDAELQKLSWIAF
jgi:hypothetical protein